MKIAATLFLLAYVHLSFAQNRDSDLMEDRSFQASNGMTVNYLLFIPENYDPSQRYPLVVTLHGSGSDYKYQVDNNDQAHPWIEDSIQARVPHFFMAPGCPGSTWGGMMGAGTELAQEARATIEAIEDLKTQYNLDSNRFVICGFSLGGAGTYHQIQFMPDYWSAAIPSSAGGSAAAIDAIANTPIWHHQGANDGGGGALTRMADALEAGDYPVLRINSDLVITSPAAWDSETQRGTAPEDIIFKNASPSYDEINSAIESGERYLFQMIRNGSHEDGRINANHNPLVAKWAFMQSKGDTTTSVNPRYVIGKNKDRGLVLTLEKASIRNLSNSFDLLGRISFEMDSPQKAASGARVFFTDADFKE